MELDPKLKNIEKMTLKSFSFPMVVSLEDDETNIKYEKNNEMKSIVLSNNSYIPKDLISEICQICEETGDLSLETEDDFTFKSSDDDTIKLHKTKLLEILGFNAESGTEIVATSKPSLTILPIYLYISPISEKPIAVIKPGTMNPDKIIKFSKPKTLDKIAITLKKQKTVSTSQSALYNWGDNPEPHQMVIEFE